jgi:hypothetical protein
LSRRIGAFSEIRQHDEWSRVVDQVNLMFSDYESD